MTRFVKLHFRTLVENKGCFYKTNYIYAFVFSLSFKYHQDKKKNKKKTIAFFFLWYLHLLVEICLGSSHINKCTY